jgi:hypothetical protein
LAGGVLLTEAVRVSGLDRALSAALGPWRKPLAVHDPAKVLLDVALAVAAGGDCLADAAVVRSAPGVYGPVASAATVSRLFKLLGSDAGRVERAVGAAVAVARARVWALAGDGAPHAGISEREPLVVDLDATLVTAHSEKEQAAATFKKGFGFHPLCAFADHGPAGSGEPLHVLLRPGNAGSNTAADHIAVARAALASLPVPASRKVLVRADGAGGTKEFTRWLQARGVRYSVGFTLPLDAPALYRQVVAETWTPALDADGGPRDGADVSEWTGLLDLSGWPKGMRVIVRRERPHPGAQLRFDDVDGYRLTAFATNAKTGQHQHLELRHRLRARCEDRIRCAKDTGLAALPLQGFGQNRVWCLVVQLACCLIAWAQTLAWPDHQARRWEPKRLRWRLFHCPAELVHAARRVFLRYNQAHPWAQLLAEALSRIRAMPDPA